MKLPSLIAAGLFGTMVYLVLELVFGSYGLLAYGVVLGHRDAAIAALETIEARHEDLLLQSQLLAHDATTIRLEARAAGFLAPGETLVRIAGWEPRPQHRYVPGPVAPAAPVIADNRPLFRSIGFSAALVFLIIDVLGAKPRLRVVRRKETEDEGWDIEVDDGSV